MNKPAVPQLPSQHLGSYTLLERLSESFFGPRWVAHGSEGGADATTELVTIRCVNSRLLSDEHTIDRLASAAWWALLLEHPHTTPVCDVVVEQGRLGIVSPFYEGDTLRLLLRRAHRDRLAIPVSVAVRILLDLLEGIGAVAHAARAHSSDAVPVHGGVTPDSVHVGADGFTRLLDVGVAAMASADHSWDDDPVRAAYDAPERAAGLALDARGDVFVCGVLAWEMLTCEHLFSGTSAAEVARRVREMPVPSLEGRSRAGADRVPPELAALVVQALSRDPETRLDGHDAMADALRALDVKPASRDEVGRFVKQLGGRVARERRVRLGTTDTPPEPAPPTDLEIVSEAAPGAITKRPTPPAPGSEAAPGAITKRPMPPEPAPPTDLEIVSEAAPGAITKRPAPPEPAPLPELELVAEPADAPERPAPPQPLGLVALELAAKAPPSVIGEPPAPPEPTSSEAVVTESPSDGSLSSLTLGDLPPLPTHRWHRAVAGAVALLLVVVAILLLGRSEDRTPPAAVTAGAPPSSPEPAAPEVSATPGDSELEESQPADRAKLPDVGSDTPSTIGESPADAVAPVDDAVEEVVAPREGPAPRLKRAFKRKRRTVPKKAQPFIPDDI